MPTFTLKNIPDEVYERLKEAAQAHRRSMNSEILVCLEAVLMPGRVSPVERVARARALRASVGKLNHREVDVFKRKGRV